MTTHLICTVGGSHQPIVKAIQTLKPGKVIFICSKDDEETNKKGSYISVIGKGKVNKSKFNLADADLPNIKEIIQLADEQFQIIKVPSDDLNACYIEIQQAIRDIDISKLIADYTGGTKTMSVALAMVATDNDIELNLVVGTRADLIKVTDGSEESVAIDIRQLRFQRAIKPLTAHWQSFAYHQALTAAQLITLTTQNKSSRNLFIQLSKAFAAWDRFDHTQALGILESYRAKIGSYYAQRLSVLRHLVDATQSGHEINYTPYQIYDVWNSAERKASQGYYDDAIARVYRVLEWSAQWILLKEKGWKTAELPDMEFPEDITITINRHGQKQAGLYAAWQLVQIHAPESLQGFVSSQLDTMMNHVQIRNNSILAHGFEPVSKEQWDSLHDWMTEHFLPMLQTQVSQHPINIKIKPEHMQLPETYPPELLT